MPLKSNSKYPTRYLSCENANCQFDHGGNSKPICRYGFVFAYSRLLDMLLGDEGDADHVRRAGRSEGDARLFHADDRASCAAQAAWT